MKRALYDAATLDIVIARLVRAISRQIQKMPRMNRGIDVIITSIGMAVCLVRGAHLQKG